tara:strand:- start:652 stop:2004 length:1353 start_codon:yes stop_codon:yes gene_type:complete
MKLRKNDFGKKFKWGVATSSFQIEGSNTVDQKLDSIWDIFTKQKGNIRNNDNAINACNHYELWKEDFQLIQNLGVNSYRFSISWPRIVKKNLISKNQKGIDFYKFQIEELLEKGIKPFLTLNHWDIPQIFLEKGGWTNRDCIDYFLEYVNILSYEYGNIIENWITHNEPWVISHLGYSVGTHAPGIKSFRDYLKVSHHLLLSHGKAIPIIRENSKNSEVGIVLNLTPAYPESDSPYDKKETLLFNQFFNKWFLDPLYGNRYPVEIIEQWKTKGYLTENLNFIKDGDYSLMSGKTDFLGINYYSRAILKNKKTNNKKFPIKNVSGEKTKFGWEVFPDGLEKLLIDINNDYKPNKIYITENGCSYDYSVNKEKQINDVNRINYFKSHLLACRNAIKKGVPLEGYFHWSLMDNFEWAEGYYHRFGLIHVDYNTYERIPKASFEWYKNFLSSTY